MPLGPSVVRSMPFSRQSCLLRNLLRLSGGWCVGEPAETDALPVGMGDGNGDEEAQGASPAD